LLKPGLARQNWQFETHRWLWVLFAHLWTGWRTALVIVKPETVIAWHRRGFRLWWTWKSRRRIGRPTVPADIRTLIRTMAEANPRWGAPRSRSRGPTAPAAFADLAYVLAESYRPDCGGGFLRGPDCDISSAVRPGAPRPRSATCSARGGTAHPTAAWTAQQLREAFPWDGAPRFLIHDRDHAFERVATTAKAIGIEEVLTAPHAPWQNAFVERFIGSARRECLDHVIVFGEAGLRRLMKR